MPARQLHLFTVPNPLTERLGERLFRAAPRGPGVYLMTGPGQRVLHVGQSKNLRVRLASYKNAKPDRAPPKVINLVRPAVSVTWE
jgi:excinuclease UvrABC nuclease subunit